MSRQLGLNPQGVSDRVARLNGYLGTLDNIAYQLTSTNRAAMSPQSYGIDPGELTVAPWTRHHLTMAIGELNALRASIAELTARALQESGAQQSTSNNNVSIGGGAHGPLRDFKSSPFYGAYRSFTLTRSILISTPRTLLQLPTAIYTIARNPWTVPMLMSPQTYLSLGWYDDGAAFLKFYGNSAATNRFLRSTYAAAGYLKPATWWNKGGQALLNWGMGLPGEARWLTAADDIILKGEKFISAGGTVFAKGLGIFGAGVGAFQLGTGIAGWVEDGQLDSEDAWAMADGAVGLICGIGSLAPPPVGLVFAGVGAVYGIARWIGSGDAAQFFSDAGEWLGDAWDNTSQFVGEAATNVANFASDVGGAVVDGIGNAVDAVGDFFADPWPW